MRILVVDVGGTHVKVRSSEDATLLRLDSGPTLTAEAMAAAVREATQGWEYDAVSVGLPAPVVDGQALHEPVNLGGGWVGFDYAAAFGRPTQVINDAAMQALGGYDGGRMLFLGLGTGLGSALVVEGHLQPLELAHLPYRGGRTFEEAVGDAERKRAGKRRWRKRAIDVIGRLRAALQVEHVLVGGGNARRLADVLDRLPPGTRLGSNEHAIRGGLRLWDAPEQRAMPTPSAPAEPEPGTAESAQT